MIDRLLPDDVAVAETREDLPDGGLFPDEEAAVANAVEKRRREYVTVRACARTALQRLGLPPAPILSGARGEPLWPEGVVGSITHCDGYRACVVARASALMTIGVDAETNARLPEGVLDEIARPEERPWLGELTRRMPAVHWDRLLFSAKESIYKAWFPLAERWLGFEDAVVKIELADGPGPVSGVELAGGTGHPVRAVHADVGLASGGFTARLLVDGPSLGAQKLTGFSGRWLVSNGLVLTAIAVRTDVASLR